MACHHYSTLGVGATAAGALIAQEALYKVCISHASTAWLRSPTLDSLFLTYGEEGGLEAASGAPVLVPNEQQRRLFQPGCYILSVSKARDDERKLDFQIGVRE